MAYNSKSNNNVNTSGPRFKGEENALMIDFWNKRLSIGIARKLTNSEKTEDSFNYDWKNPVKVTLSLEDTMTFYKGCNRVCDGKSKSSGVSIKSTGKIYILKLVKNKDDLILSLEKDINIESRKSQGTVDYKFNNAVLIEDYDGETGSSKIEDIATELELFMISIKEFMSFVKHVPPKPTSPSCPGTS